MSAGIKARAGRSAYPYGSVWLVGADNPRMTAKHKQLADSRLTEWALMRFATLEQSALTGASTTERLRERAENGPPSTAGGALTALEAFAERSGKVLQVERLVQDLAPKLREAVAVKYLAPSTAAEWARREGIEPATIRQRIARALDAIGKALAIQSVGRPARSVSAGKPRTFDNPCLIST